MLSANAYRFYLLCREALASASAQSCELRMLQSGGGVRWVSLQGGDWQA
jgi:hypothetical protein